MKNLLIVLALLLSACASHGTKDSPESVKGTSIDSVVKLWGQPTDVYGTSSGSVFVYTTKSVMLIGTKAEKETKYIITGNSVRAPEGSIVIESDQVHDISSGIVELSCTTRLYVNDKRIVIGWVQDGNNCN